MHLVSPRRGILVLVLVSPSTKILQSGMNTRAFMVRGREVREAGSSTIFEQFRGLKAQQHLS